MEIDITGIDKAELLAGLYNHSKPLGKGMLQYDAKDMSIDEARTILATRTSFDYLKGRVMKISLDCNTLETYLYDRDNGEGSAQRVVDEIGNPQ